MFVVIVQLQWNNTELCYSHACIYTIYNYTTTLLAYSWQYRSKGSLDARREDAWPKIMQSGPLCYSRKILYACYTAKDAKNIIIARRY